MFLLLYSERSEAPETGTLSGLYTRVSHGSSGIRLLESIQIFVEGKKRKICCILKTLFCVRNLEYLLYELVMLPKAATFWQILFFF